ncbi:MAG: AmmeMemoRadiSam system protein B [Sphingomonadales bacterium]|nr:AmmeMemoRadiSam system protein B [Sphingomonadales bacterium]
MTSTRAPAVAGSFYPGSTEALDAAIARLMAPGEAPPPMRRPKAVIVPHAGYAYSGRLAGLAFARLRQAAAAAEVRRVVLLGPAHRVAFDGLALPGCDRFATPLGDVPVDGDAVAALADLPQVITHAEAHAREHALEVQVPFLQRLLNHFTLVPLVVGRATATDVAEVIERLWGGPETLIVISSDLSHYLPYDDARSQDRSTLERILAGQPLDSFEQACGALPINGMLAAARHHGLKPQLVGWCNSGDTAGDRARVVGYAALEFTASDALPADAGAVLLRRARAAIARRLGLPAGDDTPAADWLDANAATFVTLTRDGHLRGCIGSLVAHRPLRDDVADNACKAAFDDPRFPPLTAEELPRVRVEVSLLSPQEPLRFTDEADARARLRPGIDGVVLTCGRHRGTFLPQVWEQLPTPQAFLDGLKRKAGLPGDFWSPDLALSRYTVRKWQEPT